MFVLMREYVYTCKSVVGVLLRMYAKMLKRVYLHIKEYMFFIMQEDCK